MPFNEEKDEEDTNKLAMPQKVQDEIVCVIQTSLNNIAAQVNHLNQYAEDVLGRLAIEIHEVFCRFKALQGRVIQLNNGIAYKEMIEESSLQAAKSKRVSQSTATQTEPVHPSTLVPIKMYETRDASVQTLPLNMSIPNLQDSEEGPIVSHDTLYCLETSEEMFVPESEEQKLEKCKQKNKHLDHPKESETVPQHQLMESDVSVDHIPAVCGEISHSRVDGATESSSFPTYPFSEISKVLTRAVGNVLSNTPHLQRKGAGDLGNSYVSYGTGMGEELKPQPQIRRNIEVFVSPTAPTSPPPLPPDWLSLLRASKTASSPAKTASPPAIIHPQTDFLSPVCTTPAATSLPERTFQADLPVTPGKKGLSPDIPIPLPYHETTAHDLLSPDGERGLSAPVSPQVISQKIETKDQVTDQLACSSVAQSPKSLSFPPARSSLSQSPRPSVTKSPRISVPSTSRSPRVSLPKQMTSPLSKSSTSPLPRYSTPKTTQRSVALSSSSCSQAARSSVSHPRHSFAQSPKSPVVPSSRRLQVQSSRSSVASSGRSSIAQSTGQMTPPQQKPSSLNSARPFTLQSLFSFPQSSSCASSPQALSVFQPSPAAISPDMKQSPSVSPVFTKAKSALMEAIRRGVMLRKTEDHCVLKAKIEISKNKETSVLIHRKPIG